MKAKLIIAAVEGVTKKMGQAAQARGARAVGCEQSALRDDPPLPRQHQGSSVAAHGTSVHEGERQRHAPRARSPKSCTPHARSSRKPPTGGSARTSISISLRPYYPITSRKRASTGTSSTTPEVISPSRTPRRRFRLARCRCGTASVGSANTRFPNSNSISAKSITLHGDPRTAMARSSSSRKRDSCLSSRRSVSPNGTTLPSCRRRG